MNVSVSQILSDKFSISLGPGQKGECPFCRRATFSIRADDGIGKCFHPACGRFLAPGQHDGFHQNTLYAVLDQVFRDWHEALLDPRASAVASLARRYLLEERRLHLRVVADAPLGVVPCGYDAAAPFRPLVGRYESEIEKRKREIDALKAAEEEKRKGKQGRPKKNEEMESLCKSLRETEESLRFLKEKEGRLADTIGKLGGWIAFFYTDALHRIVSVKLRKPYDKRFSYFKPFSESGLFGHGLFDPEEKREDDRLVVCEGEFNALQLQSLLLRHAESIGKSWGYAHVCAVGGAAGADYREIRRISNRPVFCHDDDKAGMALVERARDDMHVEAFTTPKPHNDLDEHIRSFGDDVSSAWKAVGKLVKGRKLYPRHFKKLKQEVFETRQKHGATDNRREFEIHEAATAIVLNDLKERGKFYFNLGEKAAYFFDNAAKQLIAIDRDCHEFVLLLAKFGALQSERLFNYALDRLRIEAFENGTATEIFRLAHYDKGEGILYLFNHANRIYRISPEKIELVDNGTDGILFIGERGAESFEYVEPDRADPADGFFFDRILLEKINFDSEGLDAQEQRLIFSYWLYSLFFDSILPVKPILLFLGEKGSGKSATIRKTGRLLFGRQFNVMPLPENESDFDTAITNSSLLGIDNADSRCKWLNDRLAVAASSGTIRKRRLYTSNEILDIPVRCRLALTARTPHFTRDDVADRLLIMKVKRFDRFASESALLEEAWENRDRIMSEIVRNLQKIVGALRDGPAEDASDFRLADFAAFAIQAARFEGKDERLRTVLGKMGREQSSFTLENDSVYELLCEWASWPDNSGRAISNMDLCAELAELAESKGFKFYYKDRGRGFVQKISQMRSNLREFFHMEEFRLGKNKSLFSYVLKKEEAEAPAHLPSNRPKVLQ